MNESYQKVVELLSPETDLEREILSHPLIVEGMEWGMPRFGHPEGKILLHVREVLDNVDRIDGLEATEREKLRLVSIVHDTFKFQEVKTKPRDWSKHHSKLAAEFLKNYDVLPDVYTVTKYHDDAYHAWRAYHIFNDPVKAAKRLEALLEQVDYCRQLYYLFFKCDTQTGDKNPAPLKWFESTVPDIEIVKVRS